MLVSPHPSPLIASLRYNHIPRRTTAPQLYCGATARGGGGGEDTRSRQAHAHAHGGGHRRQDRGDDQTRWRHQPLRLTRKHPHHGGHERAGLGLASPRVRRVPPPEPEDVDGEREEGEEPKGARERDVALVDDVEVEEDAGDKEAACGCVCGVWLCPCVSVCEWVGACCERVIPSLKATKAKLQQPQQQPTPYEMPKSRSLRHRGEMEPRARRTVGISIWLPYRNKPPATR
jgi:hypothetical protein